MAGTKWNETQTDASQKPLNVSICKSALKEIK